MVKKNGIATLTVIDSRGEASVNIYDGKTTFEDLTPEQKEWLKGEKGDPGKDGKDGILTFEDFTPEQLEKLRGPQGI